MGKVSSLLSVSCNLHRFSVPLGVGKLAHHRRVFSLRDFSGTVHIVEVRDDVGYCVLFADFPDQFCVESFRDYVRTTRFREFGT